MSEKQIVLVSDYDNTLKVNNEISVRNRNAIRNFQSLGFHFVINSGRSFHYLKSSLDEMNMFPCPVITGSGSQSFTSDNRLLFSHLIKNDIIVGVIDQLFHTNSTLIQVCGPTYWKIIKREDVEKWNQEILNFDYSEVNSISTKFNTHHEAIEFAQLLNRRGDVSAYCNNLSVDIAPKGVSKSTGIHDYVKACQLVDYEVFVIGDGHNDLQMIQEFQGFCVKNSHQDIISIASKQFSDVCECIKFILSNRRKG